jgi:hypothetical protein
LEKIIEEEEKRRIRDACYFNKLKEVYNEALNASWAYPDDYNLIGTFRGGGITTRAGMMGIINSVTYYYHCLICDILSYRQ